MKRLGQTLSSFMSTLLAHPGRLVITVLVAVGLILSASSFAASKPAPNKKCTAAQQKKTPKKCKPPAKKGAPAQKKNCTAAQQKKTPKKCKPPAKKNCTAAQQKKTPKKCKPPAKKNCTAAQQKKTPKKCKPPAKKGAPAEPANDNDQEEKAEDEPTADEDTGPEESVEEADPKVPKEVGTSEAADSAADRAADSAADRAADSAADRAADSAADRAADSAADRAADSAADRAPSAAGRADADIPNAPRDSTQEAPAKDQTENDKPAADRSPSNAEGSGDVAQADRTPDAAAYGTAPGGQAEAGNRVAEDQGEPIPVAGSSDDKSDKKPGIWSLVAKIVAGVTVLVGGYFGVRKYYNSRDSSDETSS